MGTVLVATVQASSFNERASLGLESHDELTDEESSMITTIKSCWQDGEEARRMVGSLSSEEDEGEAREADDRGAWEGAVRRPSWLRRSRVIRATLVEEAAPLPPPVEAIPLEEDLAREDRRKRVLARYKLLVVALAFAVVASMVGNAVHRVLRNRSPGDADGEAGSPPPAEYEPTLQRVRREGVLRCGVAENKLGLSRYNDDTAAYEGLAVNLCTAVAVAVV